MTRGELADRLEAMDDALDEAARMACERLGLDWDDWRDRKRDHVNLLLLVLWGERGRR